MKDAPYLLVLLVLMSIVLSVALRVMWRALERAAYVRIWSIAYAVGACGFLINIVAVQLFPRSYWYLVAAMIQPVIISYLTMLGYRQRAGLCLHHARFLGAIAAVGLLLMTTYLVVPMTGIRLATAPCFAAVMFRMAARDACSKLSGGAERTARVVLYAFSGFEILLGCVVLRVSRYDDIQALQLFDQVRMLGVPFLYLSSGLMGVLVIAADMAARMERLAETDTLTGLMNRRGIERAAKAAMHRCRTAGHAFTAVIADLDLFKKINDEYGHGIGDLALQRFSAYLRTSIPDPELLGRLGGEEFILMLENTPEAQGLLLIEEIRAGVTQIPIADLGLTSLTCSFGLSEMLPGDQSLVDMLARADSALYAAKSAGRDRVYSFPAHERGSVPGAQRGRKYRGAARSEMSADLSAD
jgi:diguanylate cyclase (GGDEF)-like protein